ncbi:MAG: hypothetical protein R3F49_24095 [Planctomycetota bacterium]
MLTGLDLMQTELIARSATIALVDVTVGDDLVVPSDTDVRAAELRWGATGGRL